MTRQEANIEICNKLLEFFKEHENVRFNQGLFSLNITEFSEQTLEDIKTNKHTYVSMLKDNYAEESEVTLKKIKNMKKIILIVALFLGCSPARQNLE